jgi:excisionase family DNA binding protein
MAEMTVSEAAAYLGITNDAVRRRIRRGELQAKQDDRGRYVVVIDTDAPVPPPPRPEPRLPQVSEEIARLRLQLEHERELLAEVRRQRDELAVLLDAQRAQIEAAFEAQQRDAEERAELRRLLGNAQMQLSSLLPPPRNPDDDREEWEKPDAGEDGPRERKRRRWWWPFGNGA